MKISRPIATTATIATFFLVGATGALMFFDLKNHNIKTIHEYIGIVMVLACALHIVVNFVAFKKYFTGKKLGFIALSIAVAVAFMIFTPTSSNMQKNPQKELYNSFMSANLNNAITLLNSDKTVLNSYLDSKNIKFEDINIREFITKNRLNEQEFINILLNK